MSLNLGNEAIDAIRALHQHADGRVHLDGIRKGMLEQSRKFMNSALDGPATDRHMLIGYAKAFRDMVTALESAATGTPMARVEQNGPMAGKNNAAR